MKPLRIIVVGGSLGGLFAATLLQQAGHELRVFERSSAGLGGRGAGLVAQPDVFEILRQIDRESATLVGVVAQDRITLDRAGQIIGRQATPQMQISWDNLYRSVRTALGDHPYVTGRGVVAAMWSPEGASVQLDDGAIETADLVIGADGLGSVVRTTVVGEPLSANRFAGYVAWRGLVPEKLLPPAAADQLLDRFAFHMATGSQALGYSVTGPDGEMEHGARRYNWVWYRRVAAGDLASVLTDAEGRRHPFSLAPGQTASAQSSALRADAAAQLPPSFAAAVAAEPRPFVQAIFDYEAPRMILGRLALLGDAAFVVRPHTAMGVSKAAADAMSLQAHLQRLPLHDALEAYERDRMPAGAAIATYGRRLGASLE